MPEFATVPDPVGGPQARGRIRYDLRGPSSPTDRPTLVLVGGMTQTVSSWGGQLRPLSATRPVLAYETRGQGSTTLDVSRAGLPQHANDFAALVEALSLPTPLDLCGFSFGGRVSMAIAAAHPGLVRRLVLSGVGLGRDAVGQAIVDGWIATLRTGDLEALARVTLADIVGPSYLRQHAEMIEPMVRAVVQRNSFRGIEALFRDTMGPDRDPAWTVEALVERIEAPALVMGGALDRLASPPAVRELATRLGASHRSFDDAGHTIPIEAAGPWRDAVLSFLDADR